MNRGKWIIFYTVMGMISSVLCGFQLGCAWENYCKRDRQKRVANKDDLIIPEQKEED